MDNEPKQITRRDLLKLRFTGEEPHQFFEDRITKTPNGTFYFLPENHDRMVDPIEVPIQTQVIFKELITPERYPSIHYFRGIIKPELMDYMTKNNIRIAMGDVQTFRDGEKMSLDFMSRLAALGLGTIATYLANKNESSESEPTHQNMRRRLVKTLGIGAALWSVSDLITTGLQFPQTNLKINNAVTNALSRIQSVSSLTHPEQHLVFFRNICFAHKLNLLGSNMKRDTPNPFIGYILGAAHSAVRDLIPLGQDLLRECILLYPKDFFKEIIEINGVSSLSSVRIMGNDNEQRDYFDDTLYKKLSEIKIK